MPERHFPVRPNLEQLRYQAKELLRAIHQHESSAIADLREFHPMVTSCRLIDAIW